MCVKYFSPSLQAAWRHLKSSFYTGLVEVNIQITVFMRANVCSPETATTLLPACKLQIPSVQKFFYIFFSSCVMYSHVFPLICRCKDSYQGSRCEIYSSFSSGAVNLDQLIGIILGVIVVILFLALLIFCYAYRWWVMTEFLNVPFQSKSFTVSHRFIEMSTNNNEDVLKVFVPFRYRTSSSLTKLVPSESSVLWPASNIYHCHHFR